ncbi:MAG: energy transducer TonB [Bacteroidota bacterium]
MTAASSSSARVFVALGISLLAHAGALLFSGPLSAAAPQLPPFQTIEISLAAAPAPPLPQPRRRPAPLPAPKPMPEIPAAAEPVAPTPPAEPVARAAETDEPLVQARYEVAALNNPKPPYPLAARVRGQQGQLLLAVEVRADGSCGQVLIKRSSGHELLDAAARQTVRHWYFLPARRGDVAVDAWVEIPITFRLEG